MKKIAAVAVCLLLGFTLAYAENVRIVDLHGKVVVKQRLSVFWGWANTDMVLDKGAQLKTYKNAWCTLAFDDARKNVLTIKENSLIKLEDLFPVMVSLPQGRVFVLIEDMDKVKDFKIKTPVAIAGVRGTGESVESSSNGTNVCCFLGELYLQWQASQGSSGDGKSLLEGLKAFIDSGGNLSDFVPLTPEDQQDWKDFMAYIAGLRGSSDMGEQDRGYLGDLLQEYYGTTEDDLFEQRRRERENMKEEDTGGGQQEEEESPS